VGALAALLVSLFAAPHPLAAQTTTVVLLRHAEKVSKHPDAGLSSAGRRRAEDLAWGLAAFRPSALYASDRRRTQETLAPLARMTGLPVRVVPRGEEAALAAGILAEHRGKTVVVCGHSDSVFVVAEALGWSGQLQEVERFDLLFVLTVGADGRVTCDERQQAPVPRRR
jgi:phosphohistidine phosphatase SixA